MASPNRYVQLTCPQCAAVSVCGPIEMLARLRAAGMLRREKEPSSELVAELLETAKGRFVCSQCGGLGLTVAPLEDEFGDEAWGAVQRRCTSCGQVIPAERVELFPDVTLCVKCQREDELGGAAETPDYCPKCGAVMTTRMQSGSGITRYQMTCPACGGR